MLAAWLAEAGASVTGIDISPAQIARAAELHESLGFSSRFVSAPLSRSALGSETFDRLAGRYVLHHLDPPVIADELAGLLRPGGKAAFVETVGVNPVLRVARARLAGRYGIPKYGSDDERPLSRADLAALKQAFGDMHLETGQMRFLRIFDRQILNYRSRWASALTGALDDLLLKAGLSSWSYDQVVFLSKPA